MENSMKKETLRMERVTYVEQGLVCLDNFNMTIWEGEIFGLVPVNHYGLEDLLRLLKQNLPLYYGYVYYQEHLINTWQKTAVRENRISIIQNKSCLAEDLTVADNIFVLRSGFKQRVIQPRVLKQQLEPFLEEIGMDIPADAYISELSPFERFVVELLKAVVAGHHLIVLSDISTFISESELIKLQQIIRYYSTKGFSFLYIAAHFEEAKQICGRVALMLNGQIQKCFYQGDKTPDTFSLKGVKDFDQWVRQQQMSLAETKNAADAVLTMQNVQYGYIQDLQLTISAGECVVLQDVDNSIIGDFVKLMEGAVPESGQFLLAGKKCKKGDRRIAVIQELPAQTMVFSNLSYLDNLCFTMDHRAKGMWTLGGVKRSVMEEFGKQLGEEVFYGKVDDLNKRQKYDLVYTRVLLQNPRVVVCVQPFKNAEVSIRSHIWELIERFLKKGIAVVILALNLADSLALADKLVRIRDGKADEIYEKKDFIKLPDSTPWLYLYQERYASKQKEENEREVW